MKILVTGGAGFMGSNFVRRILRKHPDWEVINFDKLTYAGNLENLKDVENYPNYKFYKGDIRDFNFLCHLLKNIDVIFHFAAESHVDNSVGDSLRFTDSNCLGTHVLLEAARVCHVKKIVHISTDEIYGDILQGSFSEEANFCPTNPYSASKAAAEMVVKGYLKTYKLPIVTVRGCNNYGPFQYPEKIIPCFITRILRGEKVPLHGDGKNIRTYIHVNDFCDALEMAGEKGKPGETYNISTDDEVPNIVLTNMILRELGKDESHIDFVRDRPFNDKRYSITSYKMRALGWEPKIKFEEGLKQTIQWYKENESWWSSLIDRNITDRKKREDTISNINNKMNL